MTQPKPAWPFVAHACGILHKPHACALQQHFTVPNRYVTEQRAVTCQRNLHIVYGDRQFRDASRPVSVAPHRSFWHSQRTRREVGAEEGQVMVRLPCRLPREMHAVRSFPTSRQRASNIG